MTKKRTRKAKPQFSGIKLVEPETSKTELDPAKDQKIAELRELLERARQTLVVTTKQSRTISWPRTWWEHFKQDCFPIWAKVRWPVQFEERHYWEVLDTKSAAPVKVCKQNPPETPATLLAQGKPVPQETAVGNCEWMRR